MARNIVIEAGELVVDAELTDSAAATVVWEALPFTGRANRWGDEIYFSTGLEIELDSQATETMEVGSLAYWPPGKAFCIVFGPTPASGPDGVPRLASACNYLGTVLGDAGRFRAVGSGTTVTVRRGE